MEPVKVHKSEWQQLSPEEKIVRSKINKASMAKSHREYLKRLSLEDLAQLKSNAAYDKEKRRIAKEDRERAKALKLLIQREISILEYMKAKGCNYYHHGEYDSIGSYIDQLIKLINETNNYLEYNSYIWNYQGEGNNYMPISQMGKIWRHDIYETIYDVPLDGTQIFYSYDSGGRGLGAFHRISCHETGKCPFVPKVKPGGFPQITAP